MRPKIRASRRGRAALLLSLAGLAAMALLFVGSPQAQAQRSVPGVPENVQLTAGDGKLTLTWSAPSSWGSFAAKGYEIDVAALASYGSANPPANSSSDWQNLSDPGSASTSYTLTGTLFPRITTPVNGFYARHTVRNGTKYHLRIRAISANPGNLEDELPSSWVVRSGTPMAQQQQAPGSPTSLGILNVSGDVVRFYWTSPTTGTVTHYDVGYTRNYSVDLQAKGNGDPAHTWVWYYQRAVDDGTVVHTGLVGSTESRIEGLRRGTYYRFRVRAGNGDNASAWVQTTFTTTGTAPTGLPTRWWEGYEDWAHGRPGGDTSEGPIIPESGDSQPLQVNSEYGPLIAQMREWRNDPQWVSYKSHTDRWDRALLAFGETVADTSLTPMTAAEAQVYADTPWGERWVNVALALEQIEGFRAILELVGNQGQGPQPPTPEPEPVNQAPTVVSALSVVTITRERGTQQVSLAGVFADADGDSLSVSAQSSNQSVVTVSAAADGSSLTLTAQAQGTATITVSAADGNGGSVSDTFTVTVKPTPQPEPTPEPEPTPSTLTGAAERYDVNANGKIDVAEYIQALRDRAAGRLTDAEWEQLLNAYLAFAYG